MVFTLVNPIDIADFVIYTEKEKTNESSVSLMAFSRVYNFYVKP